MSAGSHQAARCQESGRKGGRAGTWRQLQSGGTAVVQRHTVTEGQKRASGRAKRDEKWCVEKGRGNGRIPTGQQGADGSKWVGRGWMVAGDEQPGRPFGVAGSRWNCRNQEFVSVPRWPRVLCCQQRGGAPHIDMASQASRAAHPRCPVVCGTLECAALPGRRLGRRSPGDERQARLRLVRQMYMPHGFFRLSRGRPPPLPALTALAPLLTERTWWRLPPACPLKGPS